MAAQNIEWRYHYVMAQEPGGIDFDRYGRNGFELCGLTSHDGPLLAVFKRSPTEKDTATRAARKAKSRARRAPSNGRGPSGRG